MSGLVLSRSVVRQADRRSSAGLIAWLGEVMRAIETRRRLAQMDDRMLKDIGISRTEALEEAKRAPWDFAPRCAFDLKPWEVR